MKQVRFAILGTGNIARVHARAIKACQNAELVACFARDRLRLAAFAEEFGIASYSDLESLLSSSDIDAVTIATPTGTHLDMILRAAAFRKHILCEKPLEINTERIDQAIQACEEAGVTLACVFQSRLNRHVRRISQAIAAGRFGRLILASVQLRWFRDQNYYDQGGWRGTWALDGGGVLMNQAIHFVDLLCYLAGDVKRVQAFTTVRTHERIEVEDTVSATLEYSCGALGTIEASTCCAPGFSRRLEISGEYGTAVLEDDRLSRWTFTNEHDDDEVIREQGAKGDQLRSGSSDPTAIDYEGHRRLVSDLSEAIIEMRDPNIPGREARHAVRLAEAIYESAKSGRSCMVSEIGYGPRKD